MCPGDQDHSLLGTLALPLQKLMQQGTKRVFIDNIFQKIFKQLVTGNSNVLFLKPEDREDDFGSANHCSTISDEINI